MADASPIVGEAMMMHAEGEVVQPRCPTCSGPLVCIGSHETGISPADFRRWHAYWCETGCRGPESDGTFELIECPACGSHDTSSATRGDSIEEVECHACGTITTLQVLPSGA
jgi:ribosomal protein S27E